MKLSISVALLLVVVLARATEAGWVRKTLGTVGNVAKTVITKETVKGVAGIVKGLGPGLVMGAIGKRSVDSQPLQGAAREAKARSLLRELELACTQFSDLQNKKGLNDADLRVAFAETDENKDGRLNAVELDLFENVIDAVPTLSGYFEKAPASSRDVILRLLADNIDAAHDGRPLQVSDFGRRLTRRCFTDLLQRLNRYVE